MEIKIQINDVQLENLAKDIMDNYPEYSINLFCINYDYKAGRFSFYDEDTGERYIVMIKDVVKHLPGFIQLILEEELFFSGLTKENILNTDGADWDAVAVDALTQYIIFGEVIYG